MKLRCGKSEVMRRFAVDEHGTSMIELAIVLPVMLLLMVSIAEFGRFFYTYATLAKATRAGARYISAQPYICGTYVTEAKNLVLCGSTSCGGDAASVVQGLTIGNVDVTASPNGVPVPDKVTVSITGYNFQTVFNIGALTSGSVDLNIPVAPSTTMQYLLTDPCTEP